MPCRFYQPSPYHRLATVAHGNRVNKDGKTLFRVLVRLLLWSTDRLYASFLPDDTNFRTATIKKAFLRKALRN